MARFQMLNKYLPQVEHEYLLKVQAACVGALPSWEEYVGLPSSSIGSIPERSDREEILDFQIQLRDLKQRSAEIAQAKKTRQRN